MDIKYFSCEILKNLYLFIMNKNTSLQKSILIASAFVILLWIIKCWQTYYTIDLYQLGVKPHTLAGLVGILTAPLIHGSWQHVLGNSLPLILLGSLLIYGYPKSRWWTIVIIWIFSGIGVWLFARDSFHFGASGLTHGLFFYLFTAGILRRDKLFSVLLMIAFYMYGSMVLTILPTEQGISFEYHLFGAIAGLISAIFFRHWDPKLKEKNYSWQKQEGIDETDDLINDEWQNKDSED